MVSILVVWMKVAFSNCEIAVNSFVLDYVLDTQISDLFNYKISLYCTYDELTQNT